MTKRFSILTLIALMPVAAFASRIAIIDSGTDYKHKDLKAQITNNLGETADNGKDDDGNGLVDDFYGWNFAENNKEIIDYQYLGKFSADCRKFFEVQTRLLEGTGTQEDTDWMKSKREDAEFIKELQKFGNFAHGTHVTGLSLRNHPMSMAFGVKIIPTEVKLPGARAIVDSYLFSVRDLNTFSDSFKTQIAKMLLDKLVAQQMQLLINVGKYVNGLKADVANGSFGTGTDNAKGIVEQLFGILKLTPEEIEELAKYMVQSMVDKGKDFVGAAPGTLFVFAAGNSASDNDVNPSSPTNIKADNVLSVAASFHNVSLAKFSNYGAKMVDVAAPGVGMLSTIPGDETMVMSGTSQASPYVAGVAGELKNINANLSPAQMKKIIMGTVDQKDFLIGKVLSGGTVNPERAFAAARNSLTLDLDASIAFAKQSVPDMKTPTERLMNTMIEAHEASDALVLPLPSTLHE